jgi:D-serine deaminase-like pyridoxal phosphate-dependent protein
MRRAISRYTALCRKLQETRSPHLSCERIPDIAGSFIDKATHQQIVQHLKNSLVFDEGDDAFRLLLAYEYWRAARLDDAIREYQAIVERDSMQSLVAQRMIRQIRGSS